VRDAGFLGRLPDAAGDFVDDYVVMGSVAAEKAADADDGVVFLGFGEFAGGKRNFEGTGDADEVDAFSLCTGAREAVDCT